MNEDLKFIIAGLNKLLEKNFNLISFNALSPQELIQILSDVLSEIQQNGEPKIDTNHEDPEQRTIRMFSILRILKYMPKTDPASFRQGLVTGNPQTIHSVLKWILSNVELAKQRAYLARFLVMVEIPPEYLGDMEIASLYKQYTSLVDEFKIVHKEFENGKKIGESAAELKSDVTAMEKEKEIIKGRIEKMKARTETGKHLLEVCRVLRRERDKERELSMQKRQEAELFERLQMSVQRLERELQTVKRSEVGLTPEILNQRLFEEITVQTAFAKERLPAELTAKKNYVKALKTVIESPYIGTDEIAVLRNKLDIIAREVQNLVEKKTADVGIDKMAPFRQQAIAVNSMKRNTLDQLEKAKAYYNELESKLEMKKKDANFLLEQPLPNEEEFKQYIARLKAKSVIYKRCKAELSGLKAENGVLSRTVEILNQQLNQVQTLQKNQSMSEIPLPEDFTMESGRKMNADLRRSISSLHSELASLLKELKQDRKKSQEIHEKYEKLKKETSGSVPEDAAFTLAQEVNQLKEDIRKKHEEAEQIRSNITKLEQMEERIQEELRQYTSGGNERTLKDELNEAIKSDERKLKTLKEEEKKVTESMATNGFQKQQWDAVVSIFESKMKCADDNKKLDGVVVRGEGAETLILQ